MVTMMIKLKNLFDVRYGHSLELNRLTICTKEKGGIPFVSRKMGNNGIAAYIEKISGIEPNASGELTCALSGNGVLSTFLQDNPYYTGFHVACLSPLITLNKSQLLYYCVCIAANRYKYSWGRQANRTLKEIFIPDISEIPTWINQANVDMYDGIEAPVTSSLAAESQTDTWQPFEFQSLFEIERGSGSTPFVSSSDSNNGVTGITSIPACHDGNTIGVNRNGSVGEAFYQPVPFCSTEDVHIFNPKFPLNPYIGLFLTALIRREKYRFGYGRKWGIERMKKINNISSSQR
jgi:Type I restriction modification DNA specificity domain